MENMKLNNIIGQGLSAVNSNRTNMVRNAVKNSDGQIDKTRAAAEDFEAVFVSQMMAHMFKGIETNDMFGGGNAEDIYKSMMTQEYGKIIAKSGGLGIASKVQAEMIRMQEAQQGVSR